MESSTARNKSRDNEYQHFIPRFILKGFSSDGEHLNVYYPILKRTFKRPLASTFGRINLYRISREEPEIWLRILELPVPTLMRMFQMGDVEQWWQLCRTLPPEEQELLEDIMDEMSFEHASEVEDMFSRLESKTSEVLLKIRNAMSALSDPGISNIEVDLTERDIKTLRKFVFASEMRHATLFDRYIGKKQRGRWLFTLRTVLEGSPEELSTGDIAFPAALVDAASVSYKDIEQRQLYIWRAPRDKSFLLSAHLISWEYSWTNEVPGKFESSHLCITLSPEVMLVFCSPSSCHRSALHGAPHHQPKLYSIPGKWRPGTKRYLREERKGIQRYYIAPLSFKEHKFINKNAFPYGSVVYRDLSALVEVEKDIFSGESCEQLRRYFETKIRKVVADDGNDANADNSDSSGGGIEEQYKPCTTKLYLDKYELCIKAYASYSKFLSSSLRNGVSGTESLSFIVKGGLFPEPTLNVSEVGDEHFCTKFGCRFKVIAAHLETHHNLESNSIPKAIITRSKTLVDALAILMAAIVIVIGIVPTISILKRLRKVRFSILSRWLGLLFYVFNIALRTALKGDVTAAWHQAYRRRDFGRFRLFVLLLLWYLVSLVTFYLTFTSWITAAVGLTMGLFREELAAMLVRTVVFFHFHISPLGDKDDAETRN